MKFKITLKCDNMFSKACLTNGCTYFAWNEVENLYETSKTLNLIEQLHVLNKTKWLYFKVNLESFCKTKWLYIKRPNNFINHNSLENGKSHIFYKDIILF